MIANYNEEIKLDPEDSELYHARGDCYFRIGDYDKAIADFDKAIELEPEDSSHYRMRASAYKEKGDYDSAKGDYDSYIREMTKTIQIQGEDVSGYTETDWEMYSDLYLGRAFIYHYGIGDYDRAIKDYDAAIKFLPKSNKTCDNAKFFFNLETENEYWSSLSVAYNNRGAAYHYKKGEYDRGIEDYNEAIRLRPTCAATYLNRGYAYHNKGDYDNALKDYDNAVRLCVDYEIDFIDKDKIYWGKDELENIIGRLETMFESLGESADGYYYRGVHALFNNDGFAAKTAFEIAAMYDYKDQDKINQHLANLQYRK